MSGNNIIRLNVDNSNNTGGTKVVGFNIEKNSQAFVDNAFDYEVYINKCEIPISADTPLLWPTTPYQITLEATDKDDKDPIFGDGLTVTFTLSEKLKNVEQIVSEIDDIIYNNITAPFQWCYLSSIDGRRLSLHVTKHVNSSKMRIWFDEGLMNLFKELPTRNPGMSFQGREHFEIFSLKNADFVYNQTGFYDRDLYNLKTFRIFSSLPTEAYWLYDQVKGTMVASDLLGEIIYNTKEVTGISNLIYIPTVFNRNSMTNAGEIKSFNLYVHAYYSNGNVVKLEMGRDEYVSISLVFERKFKI